MQEDPERPDTLAHHIQAAARPGAETDLLTRRLAGACWPGGGDDRTDPVARGWLQMWGPIKVVVEAPACSCHRGRCTICN